MGAGEGPFGSIFMGGMFTILKIREGLRSYDEDPGWYEHPEGTVAMPAGAPRAAAPMTPAKRGPDGGATFEAVKGGHGGPHGRR
jgi:hypothetical protein